jgi:hypothetical protein
MEMASIKALNRNRVWWIVEVDNNHSDQEDIMSKDEKRVESQTAREVNGSPKGVMIRASHAVAGHNTPHTVIAAVGPHHTGS